MINKESAEVLRKRGYHYTTFPTEIAQQITRADALAIWTYLLQQNEGWIVRKKDIMSRWSLGQVSYGKAMKELRDLGLVWDEIRTDKSGKITGRELICSSTPQETVIAEKPHHGENHTMDPTISRGSPYDGKPDTLNKVSITNKVSTSNKESKSSNFEFYEACVAEGVTAENVEEWKRIRKEKRAVNSEAAFKSLCTKAKSAGLSMSDAVQISISPSRQWKGWETSWLVRVLREDNKQPAQTGFIERHTNSAWADGIEPPGTTPHLLPDQSHRKGE